MLLPSGRVEDIREWLQEDDSDDSGFKLLTEEREAPTRTTKVFRHAMKHLNLYGATTAAVGVWYTATHSIETSDWCDSKKKSKHC